MRSNDSQMTGPDRRNGIVSSELGKSPKETGHRSEEHKVAPFGAYGRIQDALRGEELFDGQCHGVAEQSLVRTLRVGQLRVRPKPPLGSCFLWVGMYPVMAWTADRHPCPDPEEIAGEAS